MLTDATTLAIAAALIDADTTCEEAGWGNPPVLLILRDRPTADPAQREIGIAALAVPDRDWYTNPHGVAGVLTDVAAHLATPAGAAQLARARSHPGVRIVGWAVAYEDVLADPDTLVEIRRIEAVDTDGRLYLLERGRGDSHGLVLIDEHPDPADEPATCAPLAALLHADRP